MRICLIALTCVAFLFPSLSNAQPNGVKLGNRSAWIESISYNDSATPPEGQSSSYFYLLLDEQENTITKEDYYHYAYKILTSEGIQEMSDLSVGFDPSYQNVTFHELKIIRGNETINQLSKNINLIQREESMDRFLYDGSKTAVINLRDIRVGDIIEYSFTRKGYNPVHDGHVARSYPFELYVPADKYLRKVILPRSRKFQFKYTGVEVKPDTKNIGDAVHYTWEFNQVKSKPYDQNTPSWFDDMHGVHLSDFNSWKEVGEWARKLFSIKPSDRERIYREVAPQFGMVADSNYVMKAIHFVQDEVRYLGFESGIHSHKPHPPIQIYEQRFGDCKDKSLLLTTLLEARGIKAYPVLVNTERLHTLDDRLPASNIFDHCVAQIILEGRTFYVDPTISNQGGDLENLYFPPYERGLVIDDDISALDKLPTPEQSTTTETQNFIVSSIGGEASLTVRTTYTRANADYQRAEFARNSLDIVQKNYKSFYANLYPDIEVDTVMKVTDNREENVLTVEEYYTIPTFWKPMEGSETKTYFVVQPQSLTSYFDVAKNIQQRKSPYRLTYPFDFYHAIHVKLPEEWTVATDDKIIENDSYLYEFSIQYANMEFSMLTHYRTKKDHIAVEDIQTFVNDHATMYDNLVYNLTHDAAVAETENLIWPGVLFTIIVLISGAFAVFRIFNRYDPAPPRYMVQGLPLGGWLILFGIGVMLTPLRLLYDLVTNLDTVTGAAWMISYNTQQYGLFFLLIFIHAYNVFFLLFSTMLAVQFIQRRSSFPRLMTISMLANLVVITIDSFIADAYNPSPDNFMSVLKVLIATLIWVPYLNISDRVKETFVIRSPENKNGDDSDAQVVEQSNAESTVIR